MTKRAGLAATGAALATVAALAGCAGSQPPRAADPVAQVRLSNARIPRAAIQVEPGTYRLVSFQRPCDGNCSRLDPAMDECSRAVDVEPVAELHEVVRLTPGEGCAIEEEQKID